MENNVLVGQGSRRIYGNEIADKLAKEAARIEGTNYEFARIPRSSMYQEAEEAARQK